MRVDSHRARAVAGVASVAAVVGVAGCAGTSPPAAKPSRPATAARSRPAAAKPKATQPRRVRTLRAPLPTHALLRVPAQSQLPQLSNGCEVTSLSMLLSAAGHPVDKLLLAREQPTDPTPLTLAPGSDGDNLHNVVSWGNPAVGFVGSVYGPFGYGIYHQPLAALLSRFLPHRVVDLTGKPLTDVLRQVAAGRPVVVWTTANFLPTNDWASWHSPTGEVRATQWEHAVLLVGYDATHVYVNNPLTGQALQAADRSQFEAAWTQLGRQALSFS